MNIQDLIDIAAATGMAGWRQTELRVILKKGGTLPIIAAKDGNGRLCLVVDRDADKHEIEVIDD